MFSLLMHINVFITKGNLFKYTGIDNITNYIDNGDYTTSPQNYLDKISSILKHIFTNDIKLFYLQHTYIFYFLTIKAIILVFIFFVY